MADYTTHTWESVIAFYRAYAGTDPVAAGMAHITEQLAASRFASGLHPVTSHFLLRLFAHETFDFADDQIQVAHDGDEYVVNYVASGRVHPTAQAAARSSWSKRSPDGFRAVERCLDYLQWFVEDSSFPSRPVV
jgi:hypothetical protein